MEPIETEQMNPTIETLPPIDLPSPTRLAGSIYLPFYTLKDGPLCVLTLQTYGHPMRYFTNPNSPILALTHRAFNVQPVIKTADPIRLGEFYTWEVFYSIRPLHDPYYLDIVVDTARTNDQAHSMITTPITRIDELFRLNAPLEFKAAVLNTAFKELYKA